MPNYNPWNYNNGYMPGYSPMQYGQQNQFQQNQFQQNQFQQQSQTGPDWIMAPSISQVEQVSVQPGQKAWIMVQSEPVFALRTADNMGLVTTEYYKFEKFQPGAVPVPQGDYVTRQEFDAFVKSLQAQSKECAE